jgi:flagellar hook-length control protein FliK
MEMITSKENFSAASLIAPAFLQSKPIRSSSRQQVEINQPQLSETDFSERLSAALDQSGKRVETAGRSSEKRSQSKAAGNESEQTLAVGLPNLTPVAAEFAEQAVANGTNALVDLKNTALQGLAAVATPVLPLIAQAVLPAIAASPAVTAVANGVATAVVGLFNPDAAITAQTPQQMLESPVIQGRTDAGPTADSAMFVAKEAAMSVVSMKPATVHAETPTTTPMTIPATDSAPNPQPAQLTEVTSNEMTVPGLAATNVIETNPNTPTQPRQLQQVGNYVVKTDNQPSVNPNQQDDLLQRQIQHDLRNATITTVAEAPQVAAVLPKPSGNPVLATKPEPVDTDNLEPLPGTVELTTDTVVKTSDSQELTKRFMSDSDTDVNAGLSENKDASLSVPVGFDRVMGSVNQSAVIPPPVAQPRPDLHEVVKQVMDGMVSPNQQLKSSQVIVTLKPEHLGEVTVKINVDGDKVTAAFHAASTEVRGILESSMSQLKQEMSQQGWNFDSDGVFGGMQEFLGQQQQQQAQQQQLRGMTNHARPDEYDDAMAFSSNGKLQVMSATAVDYRI